MKDVRNFLKSYLIILQIYYIGISCYAYITQCFGSLHLAGSGSTSGNVDPDPDSKKNRDKLTRTISSSMAKKALLFVISFTEKN